MTDSKNQYRSFGGFGVDVSENRVDDLDKKIIAYLKQKQKVRILNLGGGRAEKFLQALDFTLVDNFTTVDIFDFADFYEEWGKKRNFSLEKFRFLLGDIRYLENILAEKDRFEIVVLQRVIHYLNFLEAKKLISFLDEIILDKIFFSVSGLFSALGENYSGQEVQLEKRFFPLEKTKAETFQIYKSVCLYKPEEVEKLFEKTNWKIEDFRVSDFGNIKVIASKK